MTATQEQVELVEEWLSQRDEVNCTPRLSAALRALLREREELRETDWHQRFLATLKSLEAANDHGSKLAEECVTAESKLAEAQQELAQVHESKIAQRSRADMEADRLVEKLGKAKREVLGYQNALTAAVTDKAHLEAKVREAQREIGALRTEAIAKQHQIDAGQREIERERVAHEETRRERDEYKRAIDGPSGWRERVNELEAALEQAQREIKRLKESNTLLNRRATKAEAHVLTTVEDCRRQGVSFGRSLANAAALSLRARVRELEAQLQTEREAREIVVRGLRDAAESRDSWARHAAPRSRPSEGRDDALPEVPR